MKYNNLLFPNTGLPVPTRVKGSLSPVNHSHVYKYLLRQEEFDVGVIVHWSHVRDGVVGHPATQHVLMVSNNNI